MLPDGLEGRFRELRRRPKLRRELKEEREGAVVSVEFGTDAAVWVPRIPLPPPANEPPDGLLVLFADLTEEGALYEPVVIDEDPRILLRHIPLGTDLHQPAAPTDIRDEFDPPAVLHQRRIRFRPVLPMPERIEGLSPAEGVGYERLMDGLRQVTPGLSDPAHLLLGHPEVVQEDPREPGQVALLHIGWDEELGFEFLDAGDITIYGDADDVRARRWDRLILSPASC